MGIGSEQPALTFAHPSAILLQILAGLAPMVHYSGGRPGALFGEPAGRDGSGNLLSDLVALDCGGSVRVASVVRVATLLGLFGSQIWTSFLVSVSREVAGNGGQRAIG